MHKKGIGSAVLAGTLSLSLFGAGSASAATTQAGTAHTSFNIVELDVTGILGDTLSLSLLDGLTFASTDPDAARNTLGAGVPFALVDVLPLQVGSDEFFGVRASSDGNTQASSDGGAISELLAGAGVGGINATAQATADSATSILQALQANLSALTDVIGLDIELPTIASAVNSQGAAATQGLKVSGLDLSLGDLIALDVLSQLPLGTILDLLNALPVGVPTDVQAVVDAVTGAVAEVLAQLDALDAAHAGVTSQVTALAALVPLLELVDEITALQTTLAGINLLDPVAALAALTTLVSDIAALDLPSSVTASEDCSPSLLSVVPAAASLTECLVDLQSQLDGAVALAESLTVGLQAAVDTLAGVVESLTDAVADLIGAADGLAGVLDLILGLLPDLAGADLLSVGGFDVGINAVATDNPATSSATVLCDAVTGSILGTAFVTPSCSEGLSQVAAVADVVNQAVGQVEAVLAMLPLGDAVQLGDLDLKIFSDLVESVTEEAGYVVAQAGVTLLDLTVPSLTLDPAALVDSILGQLQLPDIGALVSGVLNEVSDAISALGLPVLDPIVSQVDDLLAGIGDVDGLIGLVGVLKGILDGLDLAGLGTLVEAVSTPGLRLLIDPVSTAEFTSAEGAPAPQPETPGELPTTGGGIALLGVLALGGAYGLRRRLTA